MMYNLPKILSVWFTIFIFVLSSTSCYSRVVQINNSAGNTKTNVDIIQALISQSTEKIITGLRFATQESIEVKFPKYDDDSCNSWIAKQSLIAKLKSLGYKSVFIGDSGSAIAKYLIEVADVEYHVNYDSMFTDGFLGAKKVHRNIFARLAVIVQNKISGEVLFNDILKNHFIDTVAIDDITLLELSSAKSTQGKIPNDNFISRYLEPFIIIGATGVAVFLFFHVRTQ
jgi:hypothetical protein